MIHEAPVHSVCISQAQQDEPMVATASWDTTVKLFNLAHGEVVRTLGGSKQFSEQGQMGGLYSVAFAKTSPSLLGCTSCDSHVYLWQHASGTVNRLQGHTDEVNGIDFHSSQQAMCTASDDCKAIVWDFQ